MSPTIGRCPVCEAFVPIECDGRSHHCADGHSFPVHPDSKEITDHGSNQAQPPYPQDCELSSSSGRHPAAHRVTRTNHRPHRPASGVGSRRIDAAVPPSTAGMEGRAAEGVTEPVRCDPTPWLMLVATIVAIGVAVAAWCGWWRP